MTAAGTEAPRAPADSAGPGRSQPPGRETAGALPAGPQKVIAKGPGGDIHGYAVGTDGESVLVVWEVASGRRRRRRIPAEDVFLPSSARPWLGLAIPPDQLRAHSRTD